MEVGKKKFIAPISLKFSECYLCIVRIYKYSYRDGRKTHINIGQKQQLAPGVGNKLKVCAKLEDLIP